MKLNLGSSSNKYEGWTNIDYLEDVGADIVADVTALPMADNSVDEIWASHVLEHTKIEDRALEEWFRVLKPGGRITVAVPDMLMAYTMYRAGIWTFEWFTATIFGLSTVDKSLTKGHVHHQVFTGDMLMEQMKVYFPDAKMGPGAGLREPQYGEVMMEGHKII